MRQRTPRLHQPHVTMHLSHTLLSYGSCVEKVRASGGSVVIVCYTSELLGRLDGDSF